MNFKYHNIIIRFLFSTAARYPLKGNRIKLHAGNVTEN